MTRANPDIPQGQRVRPDGPTPPISPTPPTPLPAQAGEPATIQGAQTGIRWDNGRFIITDGRGHENYIEVRRGEFVFTNEKGQVLERHSMREFIPREAVDIAQSVGATLVLSILMIPIGRAIARWIDRRSVSPHLPRAVVQRMEHIEQTLDSVAIEIERVSEAQRFASRILAEGPAGVTSPRVAEPVSVKPSSPAR